MRTFIFFALISISAFAQNQELPNKLTLEIDTAISSSSYYKLPRNAWFNLPASLNADKVQLEENKVKIYYNQSSATEYEFHCFYKSVLQSNKLQFEKCESKDGILIISDVSDMTNMDFPMDSGSGIEIEFLGSKSHELKISADYIVDWK